MAKKRSRKKKNPSKTDTPSPIYVTQYEITDEPIYEGAYHRLPKSVKERIERLYQETHWKPQQTIPELLDLQKKYPRVPQLYNYLAAAYSRAGETEKAEAITRENIRKNPNYLFARINQAQIYMAKKEYDKIPKIFKNKYDLKMLYPRRKKFHISEVANFMGVMGLYFSKTDQREIAELYNEILQEIASDFPIAKMLNRELNPGLISRAMKRLVGEHTNE
jgi:tetratricopeptide (TPR) repeat protein